MKMQNPSRCVTKNYEIKQNSSQSIIHWEECKRSLTHKLSKSCGVLNFEKVAGSGGVQFGIAEA